MEKNTTNSYIRYKFICDLKRSDLKQISYNNGVFEYNSNDVYAHSDVFVDYAPDSLHQLFQAASRTS